MCDGHDFSEATESTHVDDMAHGVHDASGSEEQESLKERVGKQVVHTGGNASERTNSQPKEHVSELTDGRVGEDSFEVKLRQCDQTAK